MKMESPNNRGLADMKRGLKDEYPKPDDSELNWFQRETAAAEARLTENQKHHRRASLGLGRTGLIPRSQRHRY